MATVPSAGIPRRTGNGDAPLSFNQRRLWFLEQLEPGTALYNDELTLRISGGEVDADLLERCLQEVVRRHEVLRTSFHDEGGEPVQRVHGDVKVPLARIDLRDRDEADRAAECERILQTRVSEPFALDLVPLVRAVLVRLADDAYELGIAMHHIVSDGTSYGILYRELGELYTAWSQGLESPLADLPIQFADFAAWERDEITEERIEAGLAFWREFLAGAPELLNLPFTRPRHRHRDHRGATHRFRLPAATYARMTEFCRREEVTSNWVLLAAFFAVLHRVTGQTDLRLGVSSSARSRTELENLVGFFVNTLLVRSDLGGDPPFFDLIQRTRARALEASKHEYVPFDRVAREVDARGDVPLIQVWFGHMRDVIQPMPLPGLRTEYEVVHPPLSRFDLCLLLDEARDGIDCYFEYDADLLTAQTVEEITTDYLHVLDRAMADPWTVLSRLVEDQTPPPKPAPPTKTPPLATQRIADVVEAHPEAIAVAGEDRTLTYDALARQAHRLARRLKGLGIGPNDFVGIHLARSPEMVVAILGVLESGAAYLPLPPAYPRERLDFLLADTAARVVLTRRADRDTLPMSKARVVVIDEDETLATVDDTPLERGPLAGDLAYVIHTSGSTGTPKGVPITHGNLAHSTAARIEYYERPVTGYLLLSSFAFDSSVAGIFWTLCQGGRLILPDEGDAPDVADLAKLIAEHRASHLLGLPSVYALLLDHASPADLASLTTSIVAGEACPRDLVERHFATLPDVELHNEYGPTEATVWATVHRCAPDANRDLVPIGKPVPGTDVYVLDEGGAPVPVEQPGELCIGGPQVAPGYLGRPELTAGRFVPDPIRGTGTMYRTGDRARFLPDGTIEFLGRIDDQVKIRGYRIELGEIESNLRSCEAVREATVVVREVVPGDQRLVAYVTADGPACSPTALQGHLAATLPGYMVPNHLEVLEALPRLPNGKVDRHALPAPDFATIGATAGDAPPETALQRVMAGIWGEVLGASDLGIDDDFFVLGGHSLLATRLFARLRETLQLDAPLRLLFDHSTIRDLTGELSADPAEGQRLERTAELLLQVLGMSEEHV